jgi:hypothetical protein
VNRNFLGWVVFHLTMMSCVDSSGRQGSPAVLLSMLAACFFWGRDTVDLWRKEEEV